MTLEIPPPPCPFCSQPCCVKVRGKGLGATCGQYACRSKAAKRTRGLEPQPCKACACGCGRLCKRPGVTWATPGCIPRSQRAAWGTHGRQTAIYKARREKFEAVFQDMTRGGRKVTKESILDAFAEISRAFYVSGYQASDAKWRRRYPLDQKASAA